MPMAVESDVVPESAMKAVGRTLTILEELKAHIITFIKLADADVIAELSPLSRAHAFLVLAKAISSIFIVRLRCSGVNPNDHPVKTELERLCLYEDKLEKYKQWSQEPLQPSISINRQAATRFIEHALPDLTQEQKKSMRDVNRGHHTSHMHKSDEKKRKRQHSNSHSIGEAAQEFLEKAMQELLSSNVAELKGPFKNNGSDIEEVDGDL